MRAVVADAIGNADGLRWTDVPDSRPRRDECVIRVEACGACWHDVLVRSGVRTQGTEFPVILGHEVVGEIVEIGDEVTEFAVGNRVVTVQRERVCGACDECRSGRETKCARQRFLGDLGLNGGYAELVAIAESSLVKVPDSITSPDVAIAACVVGTQLNALRDVARLQIGQSILVTGAGGGVGLHAVQLARSMGAFVVGLTSAESKADSIKQAGAHEVVVFGRGTDFSPDVLKATGGHGVDVVLENVGSAIFESSLRCLAPHGQIVLIGEITQQAVTISLQDWRNRDLHLQVATSTSRRQLKDVLTMVALGLVTPVVDRTMPMSEAAQAHRLMEAGAVTGRLLLVPDTR
jgi:D-arabinose 1-dehydrogenase-like Zn-dependent alcohol dehydrogenase